MEIGDDMAALIPDKPRPGPLRHLEHVERERVLPHGEVGDVDDGGRVLLEEAHGGELVRLQLPRRGDHERGGRACVAEDQRRGGERDDEGARGRRQQPARRLGGDQLG